MSVIFTWSSLQTPPQAPKSAPEATSSPRNDQPTTISTQAQAPDRAMRSIDPDRQPDPVVTETFSRTDAETVDLTTDKYTIRFTTAGALPFEWYVTDETFVPEADPRDYEGKETPPRIEALINPHVIDYPELPLPFAVSLRERNAQYFKDLNQSTYSYERIERDGMTGLAFRSQPNSVGVWLEKIYLFEPNRFDGHFELIVHNSGEYSLAFDDLGRGLGVTMGPGLGYDPKDPFKPQKVDALGMGRFDMTTAVIKREDDFIYKNVDGDTDAELYDGETIDWAGLHSKYFMAALLPDGDTNLEMARVSLNRNIDSTIGTDKTLKHFPTLEVFTPDFRLDPGTSRAFNFDLFVGPKQHKLLKEENRGLERVLFYNSWNWMRGLCLGLMWLLAKFHAIFGNWGISIICLTILVRLLVFPMVQKGMKEQAKMTQATSKLKPLIDAVNKKYKDNPQRKQQEIMKIYRENGVNPFGMFKGCLWLMVQMPIFFALYKLLYQSVDLHGAAFLWVQDLSRPDRLFMLPTTLPLLGDSFNLLPFITAATQMASSRLSMQPSTDPQQQQMQKMMIYFMPVMILVFTYPFPAGLMLYWLVSNAWQIVQQQYVNKHIRKPQEAAETKAKAKT